VFFIQHARLDYVLELPRILPIVKDLTFIGANCGRILCQRLPVSVLQHLEDLRLARYREEEIMEILKLPFIPPKDFGSRLPDNFLLPLSLEAMNELRILQTKTLAITLTENTPDTWKYARGSDCYSPRMYYKFRFREITPHCAFKWIWKSKCTPKLNFFAWLVLSDRLNTRNILK
jgi:hypothetical protein